MASGLTQNTLPKTQSTGGYAEIDSKFTDDGTTPKYNTLVLQTQAAAPGSDPTALVSWNQVYDTNKLPVVADGTDETSVADFSGNGYTMLQPATGKVSYKVAANGINGNPVLRFAGGANSFLRSTLGGAALTGDWWMCVAGVRMLSTASASILLAWGTDTNKQKRSLHVDSGGNPWGFNGGGTDCELNKTIASTPTYYILEIISLGTNLYFFTNGVLTQVSNTDNALTSYGGATAVTIGASNAGSQQANFDLGFLGILAAAPTYNQRRNVIANLCTRYGITSPFGDFSFPELSSAHLQNGSFQDTGTVNYLEAPFVIGGRAQLNVGMTASANNSNWTKPALLTLNGPIRAMIDENDFLGGYGGGEHLFGVNTNDNVMCIWNSKSGGLSTIRFVEPGGGEVGAHGWYATADTLFTQSGGVGGFFLELSNVAAGNSHGAPFRLVHKTKNGSTVLELPRYDILETGEIRFYDNTAFSTNAALITVFRIMPTGAHSGCMDTMTYASTISLDTTLGNLHKTTTVNGTGNATINASDGGVAGQTIKILIVNDGTSGKTITFGTNFKPSATLVGTTSKGAVVTFESDGTSWWESSRATGL